MLGSNEGTEGGMGMEGWPGKNVDDFAVCL